jgi:hypothetical protein
MVRGGEEVVRRMEREAEVEKLMEMEMMLKRC